MTLPRQARAVVFDMDGLILDNEPLYRDAMIGIARDWGYDMPVGFYLTTLGLPGEAARTLFSERFGKEFDFESFWAATLTRLYQIAPSQLLLKAGVVELLDLLDNLRLPRAIATSARIKMYGIISPLTVCSIDSKLSSRTATVRATNRALTPS